MYGHRFRTWWASTGLVSLGLPVLQLLFLPFLSGCAARQELTGSDLLDLPRSSSYYVTTIRGEELEFISLHAASDTLSGTMRTTRRRMVGSGDVERVEVQNQYREMALPLADIRRVEIDGSRRKPLLLVIAGAVVAGGAYLAIHRPENGTTGTGGGGRPLPDVP